MTETIAKALSKDTPRVGYTHRRYDFPREERLPVALRRAADEIETDLPPDVHLYAFNVRAYHRPDGSGIGIAVEYSTKDKEVREKAKLVKGEDVA